MAVTARRSYAETWNIAGLVAVGVIGLGAMIGLPRWLELSALLDVTVYLILAILALSLALVWGYGGILCFGQSAFFGLGAYTYAIAMFNIGESTLPFVLAIALPAAFAALLGYFMFYGRISDVYLGVITLTVTLILFNAVNSTAGPEYHIGEARLGGFNGIPSIPPLNWPGLPDSPLDLEDLFYVSTALLLAVYFGLRWLLVSRFGRVMVAIRENERRAGFLGYDARLYKLATFAIGGALAGLAGCLFANWGAFVSPTIFGLGQSAQIIIWVIVGGRGTLIGPVVGCIAIQWLTAFLGSAQLSRASLAQILGPTAADALSSVLGIADFSNTNLVLGAVLLAFVLLVPKGVMPTLLNLARRVVARRRPAAELVADKAEGTT
jgi:branched-chain amino acid transport system permease protein